MDAQRFDNLARALAGRVSRRAVLQGAAGGAVAGVLVGAGVRPAGAQCPEGQTDCDGTCVDLSTDMDNCGACGVVCESGACAGGTCTPVDGSGELGDQGDACSEVLPCRPELVCAGGICSEPDDGGPVTLPDTGSGPAAERARTGLTPAALAAAAVALGAAAARRAAPRPRDR